MHKDVTLPMDQDLNNNNLFRFNSINCEDIDKIISSLKIKYSSGYYDVPIAIFKDPRNFCLKNPLHT